GAEYLGEYYPNHPVIQNFWNVFNVFDMTNKKKFLVFLTGTDRVPITGIRSLKIKIQPVSGGVNNEHLPVAHTCFNLLDLPRYPTKEMMKQKVEQAISYSSGFGLA
ncbi:probable E3 ubiquitin- ligase HERC4, partial [Paramuricea clavata]